MITRRPSRIVATLVIVWGLSACTGASTTASSSVAPTSPPETSSSVPPSSDQPKTGTIVAEPVATDLDHPATFVLDGDGAIFYGERLTGEIRRIDPATGKDTSVFTVPHVVGDVANEQGLVGLALPPTFPQDPWLYAYATRMVGGVAHDQIVRIRIDGDRGIRPCTSCSTCRSRASATTAAGCCSAPTACCTWWWGRPMTRRWRRIVRSTAARCCA